MNFRQFCLNESFLGARSLDPTVFDIPLESPNEHQTDPKLMLGIRTQILKIAREVDSILPVKDVLISGHILTPFYKSSSSIRVKLIINKSDIESDVQIYLVQRLEKDYNNKVAVGTTHPIKYEIVETDNIEYDYSNDIALYDVVNDKWVKYPDIGLQEESVIEEKNKFVLRGPKRKFKKFGPQYERPFYKKLLDVQSPSARKHSANISRTTNRKTLGQLGKTYTNTFKGIGINPATEKIVKAAKKAPSGFVKRLTKSEVREIATKYKFNVPSSDKPIKHLGSTGIELIRKGPNAYYLIKPYGS